MKTHKKIGIGLALIAVVFGVFQLAHKVSAATAISAAWIDRSRIQISGNGKSAILTDSQWDANWKYEGDVDGCLDSTVLNGFGPNLVVGFGEHGSKKAHGSKTKNNFSDNLRDSITTLFNSLNWLRSR